ncbi:hypothetical protein [Campylobacter hyointestinalis]|nr:hypothetical protein [Campylobacter hyointestinalis]
MRWLEVQGLETELKELKKLDQNSDNLAQSILKIFDMDFDKNALKITLNDINYKEYKENLLKTNENLDKNAKSFLREYHDKFHYIIWDIIKNSENVEKIKSNLKIIEEDYFDLFLLQFQTLVSVFKTDAPLALIFGLGTEKIRKMLLAYINIEEAGDHNKYCYIGDEEIDILSVNGVAVSMENETKEYLKSINLKPIDYLRYGYFDAISKVVYNSLKFDYSKFGVIKRFDGSTDGFSGADLESVIKESFEESFIQNREHISTENIAKKIKETKSISVTLKDKIDSLKERISKMDIKKASIDDRQD